MQHNQAIFETIFKRNFSDPGNKHFLEELTDRHPYFSPAQFYLLLQTGEDSAAFEKQAARTNILFNNPYWLNLQLTGNDKPVTENPVYVAEMKPVEEVMEEVKNEPLPPAEVINTEEVAGEISTDEMETTPVFTLPQTEEPVIHTEAVTMEIRTGEQEKEMEPVTMVSTPEEPEINTEAVTMEIRREEKEMEPVSTEPVAEETEIGTEPAEEPNIPAEKKIPDEMPLFEPMHMVDYFASQGIKLSEEAQTSDRLGKQLKSFTEWLKTMKKVHAETATETTEYTNSTIQTLAEKSNKEDEVLTVSMADVFAKQGKIDKAIEVLQKLSLLNPDKSAYFAAKIEYLKGL